MAKAHGTGNTPGQKMVKNKVKNGLGSNNAWFQGDSFGKKKSIDLYSISTGSHSNMFERVL
jgi:hypothetical protein